MTPGALIRSISQLHAELLQALADAEQVGDVGEPEASTLYRKINDECESLKALARKVAAGGEATRVETRVLRG